MTTTTVTYRANGKTTEVKVQTRTERPSFIERLTKAAAETGVYDSKVLERKRQ